MSLRYNFAWEGSITGLWEAFFYGGGEGGRGWGAE